MLFSIIIPIYNVEQYLEECITSVISQEFTNYEIILIDDGSTDNSRLICEKYYQRNKKIKFFYQTNKGVSSARNIGLSNSKGDYIIFLDGDDFLAENILSVYAEILRNNTNVEQLLFPFNYIKKDKTIIKNEMEMSPINININRDELFKSIVESNASYWGAGNNIYKNDIIKKNNLFFNESIINGEDCDFWINFINKSNNFIILNKSLINYRYLREGSATQVTSGKSIYSQLIVFNTHFIESNNEELKTFFANKFVNTIYLLHTLSYNEEREYIIEYIKNNSNILKYTQGIKYIFAKSIWSIMGYYYGSKILSKLNKNI